MQQQQQLVEARTEDVCCFVDSRSLDDEGVLTLIELSSTHPVILAVNTRIQQELLEETNKACSEAADFEVVCRAQLQKQLQAKQQQQEGNDRILSSKTTLSSAADSAVAVAERNSPPGDNAGKLQQPKLAVQQPLLLTEDTVAEAGATVLVERRQDLADQMKRCRLLLDACNRIVVDLDCLDFTALKSIWGDERSVRQSRKCLTQLIEKMTDKLERANSFLKKVFSKLPAAPPTPSSSQWSKMNSNTDSSSMRSNATDRRSSSGAEAQTEASRDDSTLKTSTMISSSSSGWDVSNVANNDRTAVVFPAGTLRCYGESYDAGKTSSATRSVEEKQAVVAKSIASHSKTAGEITSRGEVDLPMRGRGRGLPFRGRGRGGRGGGWIDGRGRGTGAGSSSSEGESPSVSDGDTSTEEQRERSSPGSRGDRGGPVSGGAIMEAAGSGAPSGTGRGMTETPVVLQQDQLQGALSRNPVTTTTRNSSSSSSHDTSSSISSDSFSGADGRRGGGAVVEDAKQAGKRGDGDGAQVSSGPGYDRFGNRRWKRKAPSDVDWLLKCRKKLCELKERTVRKAVSDVFIKDRTVQETIDFMNNNINKLHAVADKHQAEFTPDDRRVFMRSIESYIAGLDKACFVVSKQALNKRQLMSLHESACKIEKFQTPHELLTEMKSTVSLLQTFAYMPPSRDDDSDD